jgi:hypothetical protein
MMDCIKAKIITCWSYRMFPLLVVLLFQSLQNLRWVVGQKRVGILTQVKNLTNPEVFPASNKALTL